MTAVRKTFVSLGTVGGVTHVDRLRPRRAPRAPGVLYQPEPLGERSRVGLAVMHATVSFLDHISCEQLAGRGYTVLAMDPPLSSPNLWEDLPGYLALGVEHLRASGLVDSVVLLGHSGGGPLAAFYQALAENGPARGDTIVPLPKDLAGLPPADGMVLLDSHLSPSFGTLTYVDPSLRDDGARDPELDMYAERNGWSPDGASYSAAFRRRFFDAQARRHQALLNRALDRLAAIQAGRAAYDDDEPFTVAGLAPRIWFADLSLLSHTQAAHPLLHGDGAATTDVVYSVRPVFGGVKARRSFPAACLQTSVRHFLSWHAVRTGPDYAIGEDRVEGIDWASASNSAPRNVQGISVPLLVMPMTAHYFLAPDELIYQQAGSADKEIVFVEGAEHVFAPCRATEPTPGYFGDTVKTTFDYVDGWIAARFA